MKFSPNPDNEFLSSNSEEEPLDKGEIIDDFMLESHAFDKPAKEFWFIEEGENQIGEILSLRAIDINEGKLYSGELLISRYKLVFKPFDETQNKIQASFSEEFSVNNYDGSSCALSNRKIYAIPEYK